MPPSRTDIEVEVVIAAERRLRGDRENRADGAATVLRWLIGDDDRVPVRGPDCGELVGGSGDIIRSPGEISEILAVSVARRADVQLDETDYLKGVIATLRWLVHPDAAPISRLRPTPVTVRDLKAERVHAMDAIEQQVHKGVDDLLLPRVYGIGDSTRLNSQAG